MISSAREKNIIDLNYKRRKSLPPLSLTYDTTQFLDRLRLSVTDETHFDSLHIGASYEITENMQSLIKHTHQEPGFQGLAKDTSPILKDTPAFWVQI